MCIDSPEIIAGSTFGIAARFCVLGTSTPITQNEISSVVVKVYTLDEQDDEGRDLVDTFDSIDVADVISDTLQTNAQWLANKDSRGFNFTYKLTLPAINTSYQVEAVLVTTSGDTYIERWNIRTI